MRDRTIEAARFVLTITGLMLLFIFGARAAGQARDMRLAGATGQKYHSAADVASAAQLNPLLTGIPTALQVAGPLRIEVSRHSQTTSTADGNSKTSVPVSGTPTPIDKAHAASQPAAQPMPVKPAKPPKHQAGHPKPASKPAMEAEKQGSRPEDPSAKPTPTSAQPETPSAPSQTESASF